MMLRTGNVRFLLVFLTLLAAVAIDAEIVAIGGAIGELSDEEWRVAGKVVPGNAKVAMEKMPRNFDFLGVRGVNFDMDGNRPYINCESYQGAECPHGLCPTQTTRCYLGKEQKRLGCMAVWLFNTSTTHHDTSTMTFGLKGCWDEHHMNQNECLHNDKCVADVRQAGSHPGQRSVFCCCRSHNCNHNAEINTLHAATESPVLEEERKVSAVETFFTTDLYVAFFIVAFLIFAVVVCLIFYWVYRQRLFKKSPSGGIPNGAHLPLINGDCDGELGTMISVVDPTPLSDGPAVPSFVIGELIAQGRFGKILKATRQTPSGLQTFACKQFEHDDADSYATEVKVFHAPLMQASKYIVRYVAHEAVRDVYGVELYHLYTEYHPNGSLFDYLSEHEVSLEKSFLMITSMMEGLAFLHEEVRQGDALKPIIVHRDFKSKNVLVKADLSTCISDFGLSMRFESNKKPSGEKETIHTQVGTRRYMSPEVLEGATEFTPMAFRQIDVYAAGLVVWEVLSRTRLSEDDEVPDYEQPFNDIEPKLGEFRRHIKILKARPSIREALLENQYTKAIVDTMREMWYQEPDGRVASGCARERFNFYREQFVKAQAPDFPRIEGYSP